MTWNDDGDRIFAVGVSDCPEGIWFADVSGNFTVGDHRTEGYFFKPVPDQPLKFRAPRSKIQNKRFAPAFKIFIDLLHARRHTERKVPVTGLTFFHEIKR